MAPIVHGLESEYAGEINFVYLDIDDPGNDQFKKQLGYNYHPHFLLIDGDGNIIQQWVGSVKGDEFREAFASSMQ
jgi:hypothetical protein